MENDALTTVDGLDTLDAVSFDLWICGNDALVDLAGLHGVSSVVDLDILANPSLDLDEAYALRDAIGVDNVAGLVTIQADGSCP